MKKTSFKIWQQIGRIFNLGRRILDRCDSFCSRRLQTYQEQIQAQHKDKVIEGSQRHNMATHPDEPYYRRQYWHWLEKGLNEFCKDSKQENPLVILDLGCGQGRLTLPLAKWCRPWGGKIIAVDISPPALDFARQTTEREDLEGVIDYVEEDVLAFIQKQASASVQAVICTEVFIFLREYRKVIAEIYRVLAPRGLLMAGFRGRYYNILETLKAKRWSALPMLVNFTDGFPWGPPTFFSWHSQQEATYLLTNAGFEVRSCRGIGVCSGIEGDPLAHIAQPSLLTPEEQDQLMKVELALAEEMVDCGRYILAVATKKENL